MSPPAPRPPGHPTPSAEAATDPGGTAQVTGGATLEEGPDPLLGTLLHERYQVQERIAVGGMGVVYRGERVGLGRTVAIKVLHQRFAADPELRRRFDVEARAMSRIQHPNCVSVIDFGVHEELPYLVMDYVTGTELRELISAGPAAVGQALSIVRQILAGLGHAHRHAIVHRDIKPENIILTEDAEFGDHVRILDFGLAKLRAPSPDRPLHPGSETPPPLLAAGLAVGTPRYMAPEQTRAEAVDARSDLYGVGILLVELLTGKKPFDSDDLVEVLRLQREAVPPPLSDLLPTRQFSVALEKVVTRALAKKPEERFQSAVDFAQALLSTPEGAQARSQQTSDEPESRSGLLVLPPVRQTSGPVAPTPASLPGMMPDRPAGSPPPRLDPPVSSAAAPAARPLPRFWLLAAGITIAAVVGLLGWLAGRPPSQPEVIRPPGPTGPPPPVVTALPAPPPLPGRPATAPPQPVGEVRPPAGPASGPAATEGIDATAVKALPELGRVHELIGAGKPEEASERLITLRDAHPKNGYVQFLLGNQLFVRSWFSDGLAAYRGAITADPTFRQNPVLIRHVVEALTSHKFHGRAGTFLVKDVGPAARPFLEKAALRNPDADVRGRAARLLGQLP